MRVYIIFLFFVILMCGSSFETHAQSNLLSYDTQLPDRFEMPMRAVEANKLIVGTQEVYLWGVEGLEGVRVPFKLKARTSLDNAITGGLVDCKVKARLPSGVFAQCVNKTDIDLGLYMLQNGYVTVNRTAVYETVFEDAYVQAEMQAQERKLGIWSTEQTGPGQGRAPSYPLMFTLAFLLLGAILVAFSGLAFVIMRGFRKVIDAQNKNLSLMKREQKLREKEAGIIAVMLDTELKANKAKIEAYLVVYEEMLREMRDPDKVPKYKEAGDIVQTQPALERAVFNRNTDKLDLLGASLSSQLIHFYARVKTNPEYHDLEPDMEIMEAVKIVEQILDNGQRLNMIADDLLEAFLDSGFLKIN